MGKKNFYAVRVGHKPGIYESWIECNVQVLGFPGNEHQGFSKREEAEEYMKQEISKDPDDVKCYGVAVGRKPGVYLNLEECQEQVLGFAHFKYLKFNSISEAERFVAKFSPRRKSLASSPVTPPGKINYIRGERPIHDRNNLPMRLRNVIVDWNTVTEFYTDGSCLNNGYLNAQGGYGVCGANHTVHLSGPLEGHVTNTRAEFTAVIKALEKAIELGMDHVIIKTDNLFVMDVADYFLTMWRKNGYRKIDLEEIANRALVETMDRLMSEIIVLFEKVNAHKDNEWNNCADKLAKQEAVLMDWRPHYRILKGKEPPIITPVKQIKKQKRVVKYDKETQTSVDGDFDIDVEKESNKTTCCFSIIKIPRSIQKLFNRRVGNDSEENSSLERLM